MNTRLPRADWAEAEAALEHPRSIERVATRMPDRLSWLLRAMAALQIGERGEIRRISEAARAEGHSDIALILDVLLSENRLDPSALRKKAVKSDVGGGLSFSFPEVVRLLALWRNGGKVRVSTDLRRAAFGCVSLSSLLNLFRSNPTPYTYTNALSRRADAVQIIAAWALRGQPVTATYVRECGLTLDPADWPDLAADPIEAWAASNLPWTEAEMMAMRRVGRGDRPRTIARLLQRFYRDISEGKAAGLFVAVDAAADLALSIAPVLGMQLLVLSLRLTWLDRAAPDPVELIVGLWKNRARLRPEERLLLARRVATESEGADALREEALSVLLVATRDPAEVARLLDKSGSEARPAVLLDGLRRAGAGDSLLQLAGGLLAAHRGDTRAALDAAHRLATRASGDGTHDASAGAEVLIAALRHWERRPDERRVNAVLVALAAHPIDVVRWAECLWLLTGRPPPQVVAAAETAASSAKSGAEIAASIDIALRLRGEGAARERVTAVGRQLRRLPPSEADALVLDVLGSWYVRHTRDGKGSPVHAIVEPLSAYAFRNGALALKPLLQARRFTEQIELGLAAWLSNRSGTPGVREVLREYMLRVLPMPPEMYAVVEPALELLLAENYGSLGELVKSLMEDMETFDPRSFGFEDEDDSDEIHF